MANPPRWHATRKSSRYISAPTRRKCRPMLRVANVSAGYAGFQALFGVSLEVSAGESVAVIGPNGAGKTTLLRLISKLIEPSSGELTFEGASLAAIPAHAVVTR